MQIAITSTKGTIQINTAEQATAWFDEFQPSYADIGGIEVAARFDGAGRYYLDDGDGSLDMGNCETLGELAAAVAQAVLAGDADWSGWEVGKN